MKKLLKPLVAACFMCICTFMHAQPIDVLHYKFEIKLADETDKIEAKSTIRFKAIEPTATLVIDLVKASDATGMAVSGIYLGSVDNNRQPYTHKGNKLLIQLKDTISINSLSEITIIYSGKPKDGLIISKNKYGERTYFADNWPIRAHHWLACIDRPDDKASFEFLVNAPAHYNVISNGIKIEEKETVNANKLTHWKEDIALSTKVMVIGVAKFATTVFDDSPKGLPISAWVYPQDSAKGFYDYALATEIVKFFTSYIAPFPYKKLANVQSKTIFGGMENASAIFYAESSVTGDRSEEDLFVHEIVHQWFGDMASEKSFAHVWLSEGFATYFTNYYMEKKYGVAVATERLKQERKEVIDFTKNNRQPVVDTSSDLMSLLNANSYQKGGWFLHMLRNEVGDAVFQQIIQTYYSRFKGSNAETRDLTKTATDVTQTDMRPFFHQWLYRPGIPQLSVKWKWSKNKLIITCQQLQKLAYEFPLEIQITHADGSQTWHKLQVHKKTEVISLPMARRPASILLDPHTRLLFDGKISSAK